MLPVSVPVMYLCKFLILGKDGIDQLLHVAVMDCEGYTWKGLQDIFWSDPVFRILGMIIITVKAFLLSIDNISACRYNKIARRKRRW